MTEIINFEDILSIASAIKQQTESIKHNNILCEDLSKRVHVITKVLTTFDDHSIKIGPEQFRRLRQALVNVERFIGRFNANGWIQELIRDQRYIPEFIKLNEVLTDVTSDLKVAFCHIESKKKIRMDQQLNISLDQINNLIKRFRNILPELFLSQKGNLRELLDLQNDDIRTIFARELQTEQILEFDATLNRLRQSRDVNDPHFELKASRDISDVLYRCKEAAIDNSKVTLNWDAKLGQGSFGLVICGVYHGDGQAETTDVAVKAILYQQHLNRDFFREIYLLRRLDYSNRIVKFFGWFDTVYPLNLITFRCLLTERCVCNLAQAIADRTYDRDMSTWLRYLHHVAEGMSYIATEGIFHRDLKPENVLITRDDNAVITDFGMSITKSSIMRASSFNMTAGTPGYIAPEIWSENPTISELSDVYSFGVLMSHTLHREDVWVDSRGNSMLPNAIMFACQTRSPKLPSQTSFPNLSDALIDLNATCCDHDPSLRPRFLKICEVFNSSQLTKDTITSTSASETSNDMIVLSTADLDITIVSPSQSEDNALQQPLVDQVSQLSLEEKSNSSKNKIPYLCSGSDDIRIWNLASGQCEQTFAGTRSEILSICLLPDGRLCSGSEDTTIIIWDLSSNNCEMTLRGHSGDVWSLCVLSGDRLCSASEDKTIKIWNISTGSCINTLRGHSDEVWTLCKLSDDRIFSGSADGNIKAWNLSSSKCEKTIKSRQRGGVSSLCLLPDGRLCSNGSEDSSIKIWNMSLGECEITLLGHKRDIITLCVLPDGRLCSGSEDCTIKIWNTISGVCETTLKGHTGHIMSMCALPDGRLCSGSNDCTIKIWEPSSNTCKMTLRGHSNDVNCFAVIL